MQRQVSVKMRHPVSSKPSTFGASIKHTEFVRLPRVSWLWRVTSNCNTRPLTPITLPMMSLALQRVKVQEGAKSWVKSFFLRSTVQKSDFLNFFELLTQLLASSWNSALCEAYDIIIITMGFGKMCTSHFTSCACPPAGLMPW